MDCIFCKIVAGEIPSDILYQDEEILAFSDINPQAPVHILVIPRKHISSLANMDKSDLALAGHMVDVANQLAKQKGIAESGYRLVINSGADGGQICPHLHMHILGGRELADEMG